MTAERIQSASESSWDGKMLRYVEQDKRKDFIKEYTAVDVASQAEKIREIIFPELSEIGCQVAEIIFEDWKVELLVHLDWFPLTPRVWQGILPSFNRHRHLRRCYSVPVEGKCCVIIIH